MELHLQRHYLIRLCSGELRRWRYDGVDARGVSCWLDEESGTRFAEDALLYAWEIVGDCVSESGGDNGATLREQP